ncbi:hypothetical protein KIN34_14790 [Cellulomonas sp. DKR-3]|uniref:Uncharacterized protein n=1 Tax=Cellulomonas fulva TaxID=2835530 RepID=A0ABS5U2C5_9CELL|nr:hypothetical protein [Cellulomonas fulva]MBT0995548.1 hypothetical protein [Cellulomonas fulva]
MTTDRTAQTAAVLPVAVGASVAALTQLVWLGLTWLTVPAALALVAAVWCRWRAAEPTGADERDGAAATGTDWARIGWNAACVLLLVVGIALVVVEAASRG